MGEQTRSHTLGDRANFTQEGTIMSPQGVRLKKTDYVFPLQFQQDEYILMTYFYFFRTHTEACVTWTQVSFPLLMRSAIAFCDITVDLFQHYANDRK